MPPLAPPRRPETVPPFTPPVVAALAPVAVSLVIFAVTRSPFALLFAALGPAVAVAGWLDHRVQARRTRRRGLVRFRADLARIESEVAATHDAERAELDRRHPGAFAHLAAAPADPERWRLDLSAAVPLVLGRGIVPSAVSLTADRRDDGVDDELAAVAESAARLSDAPVTVDARHGIGLVGPPAITGPALRALAVQLLSLLDPGRVTLLAPDTVELAWLGTAPHRRVGSPEELRFADGRTGAELVLAAASAAEHLPRGCRVVVRLTGASAVLTRHPDRASGERFRVELVSLADAERHVASLARLALSSGRGTGGALPDAAAVSELPPAAGGAGLACPLGVDATGPVVIDLVADGPHAVIGGTTGTGKSELLTTWVVSLAREHPPSVVSFLLIDFKGGASFEPVRALPHVVGVVTDLDAASAARAIASLRAEIRHRERVLAEARVRTIDDVPPGSLLPRLVLVVDEFAAVLTEFPDLHELFADVAARGRSLGLHLIVCTQRPAGVVRDSLLANCPLRLSLRVTSRPDSVALLGVPDAAELPRTPRGRAVVATGDGAPRAFQVALTSPEDVAAAAEAGSDAPAPRRPWQEPLPAELPLSALPAHAPGLAFGLVDLPEEQDRGRAVLHGNTLVLGTRGSGRTTLLDTLEQQAGSSIARVGADLEHAWDVLTALAEGGGDAALVLVDDVDALLARAGDEHRAVLTDALTRLLRDLSDTTVVLTAQRLAGPVLGLAALCPHRVLLRVADRQEHHAAGGRPGEWSGALPPGVGWYDGRRLQIAIGDAPQTAGERTGTVQPLELPLAIVSRRARALAGVLRDRLVVHGVEATQAADAYAAWVGDPQEWQSDPRAFSAARRRGAVYFDRCSASDLRMLARPSGTPPLVDPARGSGWLLHEDGSVHRARLPESVEDSLRAAAGASTDPVVATAQKRRRTPSAPLIS